MKKNLIVIIAFILLVVIFTFPLFVHINRCIPGFFSTDESFGALWDSWRIKFSFMHKLSFSQVSLIAHPFGLNIYGAGYFAYLWMSLIYSLSILTTPVLTFNIQALLNLFFNGFLTYLLVFFLTKNRISGVFSGIIFAFCPYQFARIWQHLGLSYNEFMVFSLYALILLRENPKRRNYVLFFLSLLLLLSFDFSLILFGFIALCAFIIYSVIYRLANKKLYPKTLGLNYVKKAISIAMLVILILFFQYLPLIKNLFKSSTLGVSSAYNLYHRPFEDLFAQSAKPLSYFLPAVVHPIFGKFTEQFLGSQLYGASVTEHTLYLGWIPLALAFVAFRRWRIKRKQSMVHSPQSTEDGENFYIGFFIFLAIVAWLFSQPPWWKIGPVRVFMPSYFMYKVLPMYRAYCRFGIVLMLAVAVLAGFGLKFILDRFKNKKTKIAVATLFCGLVLFEFWNYPPFKVIDVSKAPAVYYWLKEQPGDIVIAEYPLDAEAPNEMYKFYQTKHEKKMINATIPGTYAHKFAQTITKVSEPKTSAALKKMGVKYVVVHHDAYLNSELVEDKEELAKISRNPGLKLIKSFPGQECPERDIMCVQKTGQIDVYEVIAN